jgi:uncharacterized protein YneF (UPF0154 family)
MAAPYSIRDDNPETHDSEIRQVASSFVKIVSIIIALAITAGLLVGYLIWRKSHEEKIALEQQSQSKTVRPALPQKVQVFMDESVRKGSEAIISGTVHNISSENLSDLILEVELTHHKDAGTEVRNIEVEPKDLGPDQDGRYSLTLTGDYRSIKLLHLKSGTRAEEIGFKTAPGAKRPQERAPETTRTIIINRPSTPKQGEEFINTPDNPARIP